MQTISNWATGFLTRLLWMYLQKNYPEQVKATDPRSFFSGVGGSESLKDPSDLILDAHAWLPEEVLRELLIAAERISGKKDVAYHAAIDYFENSRKGLNTQESIFEIIARSFTDVRALALLSSFWGDAYTTFMRLQAFSPVGRAKELIVLSQAREGFHPLIANHFMLKGNYEGFARLFSSVKSSRLEEVYLQYRVQDIIGEFPGYHLLEEDGRLKILNATEMEIIAEFKPLKLGWDEILSGVPFPELAVSPDSELPSGFSDLIVDPSGRRGDQLLYNIPSVSTIGEGEAGDRPAEALEVIREGVLQSKGVSYSFNKGAIYNAPYSRYRFSWEESGESAQPVVSQSDQAKNMTRQLFSYLGELKKTQQRLLAYAVENQNLQNDNVFLREQVDQACGKGIKPDWPGKSPAMKMVLEWVLQAGPTDATVLITGETGTGKEVVARQVFQNSHRKKERFVSVNCGAIPEGLLESELFGHEKGSFTGALSRKIGKFEWANGGTLFLDEIGELPLIMQVKLLRVLQERELQRVGGHETIPLDIRIIAATNQELQEQMEKGSFRKDLYYRLNVVPIHLPPLRERLEDLEDIALNFLNRFGRKLRKQAGKISALSLDLMRTYSWPGNIRELENVMERAVILMPPDKNVLEPAVLPPEIRALDPGTERYSELSGSSDVKEMIDRMEWNKLVHAIDSEGSMGSFLRKIEWAMAQRAISKYGSKTEAARVLKRTYRWIRKLEKEMTEGPSA